ncbi:MAG: hypothetical protein K0S67_2475, partial [Nitrososphaeraceae archaeon]|nr:hypothetical protein [Nitrososphaeraceae archaeon]MDF2769324.1 hypothetical protein [Nitrososphaeraceae archaeon]
VYHILCSCEYRMMKNRMLLLLHILKHILSQDTILAIERTMEMVVGVDVQPTWVRFHLGLTVLSSLKTIHFALILDTLHNIRGL